MTGNQVQPPPPPPPPLTFLPPYRGEQDRTNVNKPQSQHRSGDMPAVMDYLSVGLFSTDLPSGTLTPSGMVGWGGEADLDFSAIDLSFLNTYNTRVPFEIENPVGHIPPPNANATSQGPSRQGKDMDTNSSSGSLQQFIWHFVPVPGVHAYSEQADLSLPAQDRIVRTPESFADVSRRATTEELDSVTRDKILAILLSQVKSHILPALSAFPSVMLLDKLIQFFLAGPIPTASSWIHTASFRPKKARPELLLAMAAAGAVLTPDRSLRKLGFAIQEVVRNHIPTVFESDNTLVRDLEMSQAFMLELEIGLWSGSSRKTEISESFQQPPLSMLRRGSRFRKSNYPILVFEAEDEGLVLERKWRSWVEQESFKRLVYHFLSHNTQASISLLINPSISYSELDLPLPESQELWLAASAAEWKSIYRTKFENCTTEIPSLTGCIATPDLLQDSKTVIDLQLSCSSFLYAMWGMVWEYRKLARLFYARPTNSDLWDSRLAMMTRYQELLKVFDYYRISYVNESTLLLELILMHLHMSLEEIQLFCGLEDQKETSHIHASVKEWASSKTSRLAVWHAGQLVRAARALPHMHLRDFYAISLFHASLTFWAYGLASRMFVQGRGLYPEAGSMSTDMNPPQAPQQVICLDDEETTATYRYISLGRGIPALHGNRPNMPLTQLDDLAVVMSTIMGIMAKGDCDSSMPNSPLVENLLNVMGRLRDTATPGSSVAM
ncbi:hypothetical protein HBI56_072050 [Parastagonospora nodorum]|uniref:Xylanolytic transcriptional activator regulatory domain-containing protein n=2 Tax=Phaeosphaeria nodorum (strain SN15 / ATCC MYA-4574 / FGSC 10173) TaxID=321614 RepID=Q0UK47_PHANO|nr:hypothetical protein SNOG_07867 [Parastagonospora nodorum SN15]KAH3908852.1 hypothetical protein HBH56_172940 [Parastagonospora nodorum]EAT85333.1 hypothetical protein SNOG_07867 [Parastagonospora nodorum SN15]KAH3928469.1 hypothetical protein HBH54_141500 [Parastagonospora nodorum]KAH3945497.1 hypothetical protein HBH53_147020 [Parastagonospora nodorum]KAH3983645.1 hypothetical protein HBH52_057370 [Parastagonospora nodorum]